MEKGFVDFQLPYALIGISLLVILVNSALQVLAIYKKDIKSLHVLFPIVSLIASITITISIYVLMTDPSVYTAMTLIPIIIVIVQIIQLSIFVKLTVLKSRLTV